MQIWTQQQRPIKNKHKGIKFGCQGLGKATRLEVKRRNTPEHQEEFGQKHMFKQETGQNGYRTSQETRGQSLKCSRGNKLSSTRSQEPRWLTAKIKNEGL